MKKMNYEKPATELVEVEAAENVGTFDYNWGTHNSNGDEIHYTNGDPNRPENP